MIQEVKITFYSDNRAFLYINDSEHKKLFIKLDIPVNHLEDVRQCFLDYKKESGEEKYKEIDILYSIILDIVSRFETLINDIGKDKLYRYAIFYLDHFNIKNEKENQYKKYILFETCKNILLNY